MTDNKIIEELETITAYKSLNVGTKKVLHYVIDLIFRLKNEAKKDNRIIELQDKKIAEQKAEIERYKGVIKILENDVKIANIEAVKDFGKFLINQSKPIDGMDILDYVVDFLKVNNPSVTYGDSSPCTGAPIIVKGSVADEC